MLKQRVLFFVIVLLTQSACASDLDIYRQEADAFCNLHHPDKWQSRSGYSALENLEHLNAQIRSVIQSDEFLAVFERLAAQGYDDFYAAIQPEISKLIEREWRCEAAKEFYAIQWQRAEADNEQVVVPISVLADGRFQIGNSSFESSDIEGIGDAIRAASKGQVYKVLLKVPKNTTDEKLRDYFEPLRQLGVRKISLIYDELQ